jgi:hypothetical protein
MNVANGCMYVCLRVRREGDWEEMKRVDGTCVCVCVCVCVEGRERERERDVKKGNKGEGK